MSINIIAQCDASSCESTEMLSAVSDDIEVYPIGWVCIGDDEHYCPDHSKYVIDWVYKGE